MNSPVNEIFKSLTSLKKELNEQNKVNVKQKNLEKVKQFLLEKKGFITEDFKSQEQNYINQGNDPQIVKSYIERFRKIRDKNYRQLNDQIDGLENVKDRKNIDSYKTFKELETIVDYVGGQIDLAGTSLGNDIEIDAKPYYENDVFQIYYADSPRACIKYKGNIPYGWCVSKREGNMYYTYRFKEHEPSFYFVKVKDRTKKELGFFNMVGNVFNGQFKDKYHFFVIQVVKGAKIGDTTTKQYIVTSAMNDGDVRMSWDEIVAIEPRIANLQEIFKSVELSPGDKEFYNKFKNGTDDNTFCKLDYTSKRRYLDVYIMPPKKILTDIQFKCLPEDLMNLYVGFGVGLSEGQFELIKSNKNLLKRYQQITERKVEEFLKGTQGINFNYTELLILPEDKRKNFLMNLDSYGIKKLLTYSNEPDKIINILFNIGGKEYIMKLNSDGINILLGKSSEPDKIIYTLFSIVGKEFIMKLNSDGIYDLLVHSSEPDKIIYTLFNIGGKEFIINLDSIGIYNLLENSSQRDKIIDILFNIGGKEFIINLDSYGIDYLIEYSSKEQRDKIIDTLFNIGGKEFIMKLNSDGIYNLLTKSSQPEKVLNLLGNKGKEYIMNLDSDGINNLLGYSSQPEKIINILFNIGGKEFIMKLDLSGINNLLQYSSKEQPDKIIYTLFNIGGKEFIMKLDSDRINNLLQYSSKEQRDKIIDTLFNIGGKEFIMKLDSYGIKRLLTYSNEPDKIINLLGNKGKEYIMNLDSDGINYLLYYSSQPEKVFNLLGNKGKNFIMNLNSYEINYLLGKSSQPDKIINTLFNIGGKEFIMNLDLSGINNLLGYSSQPEKIEQIFQQYGKLPKDESNTPMNEIFNSLTSLQEELTEQRKLTIKESNLMKVQNFIKKRKNNQ